MKLEEQVVSLELAKRLKELGVEQDSYFFWRESYHTEESFYQGVSLGRRGVFEGRYHVVAYPHPRIMTADLKWNERDPARLNETEFSAFTVAELGQMISPHTRMPEFFNDGMWWCTGSTFACDACCGHATEADARATLLINFTESSLLN